MKSLRYRRRFPAFADQVWYLAADMTCWPGLMPHVHRIVILDRHASSILAKIYARYGWFPIAFECGLMKDDAGMLMHRWYRGWLFSGIVERWQVAKQDEVTVELSVTIYARGWLKGFLARAVIAVIARQQIEMIDLLAVAHRRAQESDGW